MSNQGNCIRIIIIPEAQKKAKASHATLIHRKGTEVSARKSSKKT